MLVAVQKNQVIQAVLVDKRQACEMIASAMCRELDGQEFNILDEITKPQNPVLKSFSNLSQKQFFEARHEIKIDRDPMYLIKDITSYSPYNYILFDLDNQKIIVPDYYEYQEGFPLVEIAEHHSAYEAYEHAGMSSKNKIMKFAIAHNLILVRPTYEDQRINGYPVRASYVFRKNSKNSPEEIIHYCFCCETFECACTPEQIEKFTMDEFPF
ncbi:hypothetical protein ACQWTT_001119 [Acinetobacter baumannii]